MTENKLSRYLLYAVGEILLVVIGILIALQINNANEERKERKKEQVILKQLLSEYNSNLVQLDQKISVRDQMMRAARQLMNLVDHPELRNKDSIDHLLAETIPYTTFDPIINDLASSGELILIRNTELKQALTSWSSNVKDVIEEEEVWKYYRNELYLPFLIEHYQFRTLRNKAFQARVLEKYAIDTEQGAELYSYDDIGFSRHEEDFNGLLDHPDFQDHLSRCYSINKWTNVQASILRKRIVDLIALIESEIKQDQR